MTRSNNKVIKEKQFQINSFKIDIDFLFGI